MAARKLSIQKEIAFILLIIFSLGLVTFSIFGKHGWLRFQERSSEYQAFASQRAALEAENQALKARIGKLQTDPETLKLEIRKRLGYSLPDEIVFQDAVVSTSTPHPVPEVQGIPVSPNAPSPSGPGPAKPAAGRQPKTRVGG